MVIPYVKFPCQHLFGETEKSHTKFTITTATLQAKINSLTSSIKSKNANLCTAMLNIAFVF
jgi:hypothetical protein